MMRLWHYSLLPYLPKGQLLSQKRECDLIWKDIASGKQTNHILINYIWSYKNYKDQLAIYYWMLQQEFKKRGFTFRSSVNAQLMVKLPDDLPFKNHHNNRYLLICFMNLWEKYLSGQKEFSIYEMRDLIDFVDKELDGMFSDIIDKFCILSEGIKNVG